MKPNRSLTERFEAFGLNWTVVTEADRGQSIVVKDRDKKIITWPDPEGFDLIGAIGNLQRINDNLKNTFVNLSVADAELNAINKRICVNLEEGEEAFEAGGALDFSDRTLRRIFANGSFGSGGRFYGGWWQRVPSEYRKYIEIDGAVTVELDFATIQPRILYASIGRKPPADSYVLPDWGPEFRQITKKAFSQLLNSDPSSRNQRQWHRFAPAVHVVLR